MILQQSLLEQLHRYIAFTIRRLGVAKLISVGRISMALSVTMLAFEDTLWLMQRSEVLSLVRFLMEFPALCC